MPLLGLSYELILSIAAYLDQVDLLNMSLVCKHLNVVTEPELYREYTNIHIDNRSFSLFVKRIIRSPNLARNVKKLDLSHWETIDAFNPVYYDSANGVPDVDKKVADFDEAKAPEPNEDDYLLYCRAAQAAGVIAEISPYETKSCIVEQARPMLSSQVPDDEPWYTHIIDGMSYDQKFCSMLRAGLEDPVIVLMVALLPNVREMLVRGGPTDRVALEWRAPTHRFSKLRRLTVHAIDGMLSWPIAFFSPILSEGRLDIFEVEMASSWYQDTGDIEPLHHNIIPLTLTPGSLNLKKLELIKSCLRFTDLGCLLNACPNLTSFQFTEDLEAGAYTISPSTVIKLLEPLKDTLQQLILDLTVHEQEFDDDSDDDDDNRDHIDSLAHLTSLKLLSVTPEIWRGVEMEYLRMDFTLDRFLREVPSRRPLGYRLPPNLETLAFPLSGRGIEMPLCQIRHIICSRAIHLPLLKSLYVNSQDEDYLDDLEDLLEKEAEHIQARPGVEELGISLGCNVMRTAFDTIESHRKLPHLKWFGDKYARRHRKSKKSEEEMSQIMAKYDHQGLNEDEMTRLMANDPDMESWVERNVRNHVEEDIVYEDE
ncbi:uncharacterized protein N0V89_010640 [Didymosphaeria variabile]|uniref:F-box domain-containing protein n=1 Tax=Didymosphaeria variabile TaxID=1932322 RepID=A0A9W8XC63_9PLEO|nr:uncharacterized protein N0V89_010640 [Didymosphaeria variabile]KAJ4346708.1 hypothetical protein N0V89_010640 [Didymosphaeria variabile]